MRRRFPGSDFHNTAPTREDNLECCEPNYPVSEDLVARQNSDLPSNVPDAAGRNWSDSRMSNSPPSKFVGHLVLCGLQLHSLPSRPDTGEPGTSATAVGLTNATAPVAH